MHPADSGPVVAEDGKLVSGGPGWNPADSPEQMDDGPSLVFP